MNIVKKIIVIGMACVTLLSTAMMDVSAATYEQSDAYLSKAEVNYGKITFRDPDAKEKALIEAGKTSAVVIDDLDDYLSKMEKGRKNITSEVTDETPEIQLYGLSDISSKYIGVHPVPVPPVKINCQFTYKTKKNAKGKYYFTSVSNIKSWLTGVQIPLSYTWSQKGSSKTFSNAKQKVKIKVNGVIGTHVIIKGVGKIMEQNMSYTFDYIARK